MLKKSLPLFSAILLLGGVVVFPIHSHAIGSLLTKPNIQRTSDREDISNLPVYISTQPKSFENTKIQLPREGDNIGMFTRETVVYEKRGSFSVLYPLRTEVKTADGEKYMGGISAPIRMTSTKLPQPLVHNAGFLGGIHIDAEEEITLEPSATIRFPLKEQQYGNEGLSVYFYNTETESYQPVEFTFSNDKKGILIPFEKTGYFGVFDSPGTIPTGKTKAEILRENIPRGKTGLAFVAENDFLDVKGHWSEKYVRQLDTLGIAPGKSSLFFVPDEAANRAEVIKLAVEKKFDREDINTCIEESLPSSYVKVFFSDIPQNHAYAKYICMAAVHKMTQGFPNGTFAPKRPVSRAEALKILYEAAGKEMPTELPEGMNFQDVNENDWFAPYVLFAAENKVAKGFSQIKTSKKKLVGHSIKNNSVGENVRAVQKALTDLQFYAGSINSVYNDEIRSALLQYQLARGIIETPLSTGAGVLGPQTAESINKELGLDDSATYSMIFKPHASVTRAELSKFAALIFELEEE